MNFLLENYLVFVLIGLFLIFALIGYLIDLIRKNNTTNKNDNVNNSINNVSVLNNIPNEITDEKTESIQKVEITNINEKSNDDLLNTYNNQ